MFYFYKAIDLFYNDMPPFFGYALARLIGNITCWAAKQRRLDIENNLARIGSLKLDKRQIGIITWKIFQNFNICLVDFLKAGKINRNDLEKIFQFQNRENLDSAFKYEKGVILLSAHFGAWELGGMALSLSGYPASAVYLPQPDKRIDDLFLQKRILHGIKMLKLGADTRKIFSALADKEMVMIVGDLDMGDSDTGVKVNFLGRETVFPRGAAALAVKTGAVIAVAFNIMDSPGHYRLVMEKPIVPPANGDKEENIKYCTQEFATILEKYISNYPEQWFNFRRLNSP
jgi:lauroyl/myristoyl acyltransferase